jgi:hypothetical protein
LRLRGRQPESRHFDEFALDPLQHVINTHMGPSVRQNDFGLFRLILLMSNACAVPFDVLRLRGPAAEQSCK